MGAKKVYLESLGCPKNLVDSELMLYNLLKRDNHLLAKTPQEADIILINTCGFIEPAKEESINTILEYTELENKEVYVIGCLVNRYKKILQRSIPEIKNFLTIEEAFKYSVGKTDIKEIETFERKVLSPKSYAYVKIAEGCSRRCSYCTIPSIRGDFRSRTKKSIIEEIKQLVEQGYKEIILVAHDLLSFGIDNNEDIINLLEEIEKIDKIYKIRLLYLYPEEKILSIIRFIKDSDKFCHYIEMPLQHIDSSILSKMGRPDNEKFYFNLIEKIRNKIPDIVLRSTFIVGFPGETKENFENLKRFLEQIKFNWVGFYKYSDEENTTAHKLAGKLRDSEIASRLEEIIEVQREITSQWLKTRKGTINYVVVDEIFDDENIAFTRSEFETPDIDGNILIHSNGDIKAGDIVKVKIVESFDYDLKAERIK